MALIKNTNIQSILVCTCSCIEMQFACKNIPNR